MSVQVDKLTFNVPIDKEGYVWLDGFTKVKSDVFLEALYKFNPTFEHVEKNERGEIVSAEISEIKYHGDYPDWLREWIANPL